MTDKGKEILFGILFIGVIYGLLIILFFCLLAYIYKHT